MRLIGKAFEDPEFLRLDNGEKIIIKIGQDTEIHVDFRWEECDYYYIKDFSVYTENPLLRDIIFASEKGFYDDVYNTIINIIRKSPEAKAYQKRIDDLIAKYPDQQDWKFEV